MTPTLWWRRIKQTLIPNVFKTCHRMIQEIGKYRDKGGTQSFHAELESLIAKLEELKAA